MYRMTICATHSPSSSQRPISKKPQLFGKHSLPRIYAFSFLFSCIFFISLISLISLNAPLLAEEPSVQFSLRPNGTLESLSFTTPKGKEDVAFRSDETWQGPSFGKDIILEKKDPTAESPENAQAPKAEHTYEATKDGITYALSYTTNGNAFDIRVTVTNTTDKDFSPEKLPLILGIDTYMSSFPAWNDLYFPTFFRCEKQSFWGYMMSPNGKILALTCDAPIASYTINYLQEMYGHYIYTISLDLLCAPPLPAHHPELTTLKAGETLTRTLRLAPLQDIADIEPHVAQQTQAPLIKLSSHSLEPKQPVLISILGDHQLVKDQSNELDTLSALSTLNITAPSGKITSLPVDKPQPYTYADTEAYGLYLIEATHKSGKTSTASFYVRPPWSWYLQQARSQAIYQAPRATTSNDSCETWYNMFAPYLAQKHFPDSGLNAISDDILDKILTNIFKEDEGKLHSVTYPERTQNVSAMLSLLVDKFEASRGLDIPTLEKACQCAEYILSRQHEQGYYGGYGMAHYTSVLYIAKSILELCDTLEPLAKKNREWKERRNRYYASAQRAIDELATRGRDIHTEGQSTFEDGAVSCSSLQLLNFALRQKDPTLVDKYKAPGLQYLKDHACLTRLLDPDARSRGATSRFWECWGDIQSPFQAMLSPHGWSGWRLYASYYAYLITGEAELLEQFMDAMGACTQLLSFPDGELLYAFVPDPQIDAGTLTPDPKNPRGNFIRHKLGASYLKNVGQWFGKNTPGDGYLDKTQWDWIGVPTYEIFKAMEETVLPHAFVCEKPDGSLLTYNCTISEKKGTLIITPAESLVKKVHVNLKRPRPVHVKFSDKTVRRPQVEGMAWIAR